MARFDFSFFDSGVRYDSPDAHPTSMRDLSRFLENPFDDPNLSAAKLGAFSTDSLQRMIANNPSGELDVRIAATTSALTLFQDCMADDQTKLGLRKARKQAKDTFRETTLPKAVERIESGFISAFDGDSPVLMEALPNGRTIFTTCRDDQVGTHVQTLLNAVTTHTASLAPAIVTLATNLKTNWLATYSASETSTGDKTTTEEEKQLARENLQLMLFLNLLKLSEMFPRQPDQLALYMRQDLLEGPEAPEEPEPPTP
jgi:hypothetical protein